MPNLSVIIDEFAISRKEGALFIKDYKGFLNSWESILEGVWEEEGKVIISHPIIKGYFKQLKTALKDRIEIWEHNPRADLTKAFGIKQNELDYLSYQEIFQHKLLEKLTRSPLEVGEDPFLWILRNLSKVPLLTADKVNKVNYVVNYFAVNDKNDTATKSARKYIHRKALDKHPVVKWIIAGNASERAQNLLLYLYLKGIFEKEELDILLQNFPLWIREIENFSVTDLENLSPLFQLDEYLSRHAFLKRNIEQKLTNTLNKRGLDAFLEKLSGKLGSEIVTLKNWLNKQGLNFTRRDLNSIQEQKIRQKFGNEEFVSLLDYIPPPEPKDLSLDSSLEATLHWIKREYLPFFIWTREHEQNEMTEIYAKQFEDWFLSHYEDVIHSEFSLVNIFQTLQKILCNQEKVLYIIVDGLSYWFLESSLPFEVKIDTFKMYCCFPPSITSVNKPSLLSGKLPQETEADHYKLAEKLADAVSNDTKEKLSDFARKKFKLGIYFVNSFDELLHKRSSYSVLKGELETKLKNLFREIGCLQDVFVILTADHGFTILPKKRNNLLHLKDIEGEVSHCRTLKLLGDTTVPGCVKIVKYLPTPYFVASGYQYLESFPKGATHGGLSPEEVTIPLLTISTFVEDFKMLDFGIKGEIWKKEIRPIEVLIENPNTSSVIVEDLSIEFVNFQHKIDKLKQGANIVPAEFDARNVEKPEIQVGIWYKVRHGGNVYKENTNLTINLKTLMAAEWEDVFDI